MSGVLYSFVLVKDLIFFFLPELIAEEHIAVDARVYTYALALKRAAEKPLQVPFMKF